MSTELDEWRAFLDEFQNESDRAAVILGAAKLDLMLFQILQKVLKPCASKTDELLDGDVPLGTFSARVLACHRLGLIDEELTRSLGIVRRIRNSFAHELSGASLTSGAHRDRVRELVAPLKEHGAFKWLLKDYFGGNVTPGAEFKAAVALITLRLEGLFESNVSVVHKNPMTLIPPNWEDEEQPEPPAKHAADPDAPKTSG